MAHSNGTSVSLVGPKGEPILLGQPTSGNIGSWLSEAALIDDNTNLIVVPPYMKSDPWMMDVVRGTATGLNNISPVIDSDLSSVVTRRQSMAATWEIMAFGRKSPFDKFQTIVQMANDGQGAGDFGSDTVGALDITNRGAFITFIPIDSIEVDDWDQFGIQVHEFETEQGRKKGTFFGLSVDELRVEKNFGLWALPPLRCWPTGDARFPFWFEKGNKWFLVPGALGMHIPQKVGPKDDRYKGWGQSGTWRYIGILVFDQMIRAMEYESVLNEPPRGIVWAKGMDDHGQFETALRKNAEQLRDGEALFFPGRIFGSSISKDAGIIAVPWTEAPSGYDPAEWRAFREDALAAAFHMSVAFIRTRIGTGAFSQSNVTAEIQSETGIAWMRKVLESIYNRLVPRVSATVIVPSDTAAQRRMERFDVLAAAVKKTQEATEGQALTVPEVRRLIQEEIGFELKDLPEGTAEPPIENPRDGERVDQKGHLEPEWIMLDEFGLEMVQQMLYWERNDGLGVRVKTLVYETPCTVTAVDVDTNTVHVRFDWGKEQRFGGDELLIQTFDQNVLWENV